MTKNNTKNNYAFIDGQNLNMGVNWKIDHKRFRQYLKDKYHVEYAYYFLGFKQSEVDNSLYENLQKAGFILVFNIMGEDLKSNKKGNVDVNLAFNMMKSFIEDDFDKVVLISGDGDYKPVVDFFLQKNKFKKILVPNMKFASSLYKQDKKLSDGFIVEIDDLRKKIEYKKGPHKD